MINLKKFVKEKEVVSPIVSNWGKVNGRKIELNTEDGWYLIKTGSTPEIIRKAAPLEVFKTLEEEKFYRVYVFGEEGIPASFDEFEKQGFGNSVYVHFLNSDLFEVARIVRWEDERFYFRDVDATFQRPVLARIRKQLGNGSGINDIKGISPEIFYYTILVRLSSQAYREANRLDSLNLTKKEKEKRVKQFQNTLDERIKKVVEDMSGKFIKLTKGPKDFYVVEWLIGEQEIKSTINDREQVINAGFCLSGDDKKHSITSLVQLAKVFQDDDPLYITRE